MWEKKEKNRTVWERKNWTNDERQSADGDAFNTHNTVDGRRAGRAANENIAVSAVFLLSHVVIRRETRDT